MDMLLCFVHFASAGINLLPISIYSNDSSSLVILVECVDISAMFLFHICRHCALIRPRRSFGCEGGLRALTLARYLCGVLMRLGSYASS